MNRSNRIVSLILAMITVVCVFLSVAVTASESTLTSSAPELTAENYTVYFKGAENLTYIRYASGEYYTSQEIKNAADCVTVGPSDIKAATINGIFSYEMPNGGIYSFWAKDSSGNQYIYPAIDITVFTPEVSVNGVSITVSNFYGATYLYIAKGTWTTYSEIKANGYIVAVKDKLIGAKSYTYTLKDEGNYTVLLKYPGKEWYNNFTIDCVNPSFNVNGLQLTVGNLEGVKCIRTAYGEYSTIAEIKKADTQRAFTAKGVLKNVDEYTIQYRTPGMVTVCVQYENGYYEFSKCELVRKEALLSQSGNTVTFSSLEGMTILRYAKGKYTTVPQIKAAADSQYLKADATANGSVTIALEEGSYTFYVQYDDQSENYYYVTVKSSENSWGFTKNNQHTNENGNTVSTLPYWLYTPKNATADMPLIVVLHSAHVKSKTDYTWEENLDRMMTTTYNDIPKYIYNGEFGDIPAYIVMPQTGSDSLGWAARGKEIVELVEYCKREFKVDESRISIMGYSLGGTGAIEIASAYPEVFSRVFSVAGGLDGVTNNIRPYLNGSRLALSDTYYPLLRVAKSGSALEYEKSYMKYLYETNDNKKEKYLAQTEEQIDQASAFKNERIYAVAESLNGSSVKVWSVVGILDAEVKPFVLKELCNVIGEQNARCDLMDGYSHSKILPLCLNMKTEIIDHLIK